MTKLIYVTSKDFNNETWHNTNAAVDQHVQNCSFFVNENVSSNTVAFYLAQLEKTTTLKTLWLLYLGFFYAENIQQTNFMLTAKFLDENKEILANFTKSIPLETKKIAYVLTKFEPQTPLKNVHFIHLDFSFSTPQPTTLKTTTIAIYNISVNEKLFEDIVHQDEIVYVNFLPKITKIHPVTNEIISLPIPSDYITPPFIKLPEQPAKPFIFWGSFGYGEFGDTYFGKGVPREL